MAVKGFEPNAVKREHIKSITVLYGTDAPGISQRIKTFTDILEFNGDRPNVFDTMAHAIGYLSCGDLFSDRICVVVSNASDIIGTSAQNKQLMKSFLSMSQSYDEASTIVLGLPVKTITSQLTSLLDELSKRNALIRAVNMPDSREMALWLAEYAKSEHNEISSDVAEKIVVAADYDRDLTKDIYHSVGNEAANLTIEEIREWMDADEEIKPFMLRQYIVNGDVQSIIHAKEKFGVSASGYRTFLLKLRLAAFESMLAAISHGDQSPLATVKAARYGQASGIYNYLNEVKFPDSDIKLLNVYTAIEDEITFVSTGSGSSSFERVLLAVSKINSNSEEYHKNKLRKAYSSIAPISQKTMTELLS